ncbi:MAG: tRNA-intron lyase [Crenarchaeota archaeon]|nr:tRNA-intron lyase [Thermoproteota archaeon]MDW8033347.1 tRNA-intron lyase [Nitrososphaerota archaeon]
MEDDRTEITAELVGDRLIIWNIIHSQEVYKMGFFGKPVGIPKPKDHNFNAPLTLDLFEGLYLLEKRIIRVVDREGREITPEQLLRIASRIHEDFKSKFIVYRDLRNRGFIVTPGIKFGCDFAIYEHGPGIDHAPAILEVKKVGDKIDAPDFIRAGRLATSVRKLFVFAISDTKNDDVKYLVSKWWKA